LLRTALPVLRHQCPLLRQCPAEVLSGPSWRSHHGVSGWQTQAVNAVEQGRHSGDAGQLADVPGRAALTVFRHDPLPDLGALFGRDAG
jgi:hypothetical protein